MTLKLTTIDASHLLIVSISDFEITTVRVSVSMTRNNFSTYGKSDVSSAHL